MAKLRGVADMSQPDLSIVLVCWQMAREVPRSLLSLARGFQRGMSGVDYEIILVDNGSDVMPDVPEMDPQPIVMRAHHPSPSPVAAMNQGLAAARGRLICAWIDGARIGSANLLRAALDAAALHPKPVIAVPNWQLGPNRQAASVHDGYDAAVEDALLEQAGWPSPEADLFAISHCELSGITGRMFETNALFLRAAEWAALGGFDPIFDEPGGGPVNSDTLSRALALPGVQQIRLDKAATFHQIHGGTTTDGFGRAFDAVKQMALDYLRVRGKPLRLVKDPGWIFDANTGETRKG